MVHVVMRRLLLAAALLVLPASSWAQSCSGQFGAGQVCGNANISTGLPKAQLLSPIFDNSSNLGSARGTIPNRGASAWAGTATPVLGNPGATTGTLGLASVSGGTTTLTPSAIAGSTALQLPSLAGTVPSTATSPIVLDATTGALSCPTCVTGPAGALVINLTAVSGATAGQVLYSDGSKLQAYGITGTAGNVVLSNAPTIVGGSITALTALAVRDTSAAFDLTLAGTSSPALTAGHTLTYNVQNADRTISLAGNATFGGTFSTGGTFATTGTFSTGGTFATVGTFSSGGAFSTSSTVAITGAFSTAAAFTQSGAFATTLTSTGITNSTLPTGTHTLAGLDVAQTWSALQQYNDGDFAIKGATSGTLILHAAATAGVSSITWPAGATDFSATGGGVVQQTSAGTALTVGTVSNAFLANSSLTIGTTSIALGATSLALAGVTSYNKVAITAPVTGATLTIADGKTLATNNSLTLAGTDGKTLTVSNSLALAGTDGTIMTFPSSSATISQTVASGALALATGAISSGTCTAAQTAVATGTATTDAVTASFNGDPTAVTGYIPTTTGMLTIIVYPTLNTVNFKVCNNTSSSITPGAVTLNWRVVR